MPEQKKSKSPGPHGMKQSYSSHVTTMPLIKKKKFKRFERMEHKELKSFSKKPLKERSSSSEGRTPKARKLTSLMRKGYRKGYRVKSTRGGSRR
jgi:hypothetical protein